MASIFICYRREDSEAHAGRLHDALSAHFGAASVFFDVDTLHPGVDFDVVIQSTLGRCKIVLVVIGTGFFSSRLRDVNDYLRREIVAGLTRRKRVIPVLVSGASLAAKHQIPKDLVPLLGKQAVSLNHPTWKHDISRLIRALEKILARESTVRKPRRGSVGAGKTPVPAKRPKKRDDVPSGAPKASKKSVTGGRRKRTAAAEPALLEATRPGRPRGALTTPAGRKPKKKTQPTPKQELV